MTAVVSVETVLLVLLIVLVVGLLRSHAEILRRLGPPDADSAGVPGTRSSQSAATATAVRSGGTLAPAIAGLSPDGDAVGLDLAGAVGAPTLLAFLTGGCATCAGFWETLAEPRLPAGVRTVIVTHGAERESPSRIRTLAPARIPVVMSSAAWQDYAVPGAPYFVLVDGEVRGEGVATTWEALASLVTDAIEDQRGSGTGARGRQIDRVFAAAGIGPEDPSLYPGRRQ
jgi:hypothetical protein